MKIDKKEPGNLMHLIPVILCGGEGSRLWPVSRVMHPKPFIRLDDGHSFLQKAFLRGATLPGVEEILTVTNRELFFKIEDEFREVNKTGLKTSFILEPFKRNTVAAIAIAALEIVKNFDDNALMLVLSADDLIANQDAFQQAISDATILAEKNKLVAFGNQSDEANPQMWNSGIFLFKAGIILQAIEKNCPEILSALKKCLNQSQSIVGTGFSRLDLEGSSFAEVPEQSIEEIMMNDSAQLAVVPCDLKWTSIDSWKDLSELVSADSSGNRIEAETCLHDVTNCHIKSESRLVGAVGVDNLIIVDTEDALLVANKSRTDDIEKIYSQLKNQNHEAHKFHRTVHRPWGNYTVLEESEYFKIKRIVVTPKASLSLQMHHHRSEHWIVVSGMAKVTNGEDTFFIKTNESTYIPAGHKHRLENPGVLDLVMIEVQSGEYLGEDDIVRFQDNYGRV